VARIGYQSHRVRQQAVDYFDNDKAEVERRADGKRRPEILGRMHMRVPVPICMIVSLVPAVIVVSHGTYSAATVTGAARSERSSPRA
jgi:hypothetical protein